MRTLIVPVLLAVSALTACQTTSNQQVSAEDEKFVQQVAAKYCVLNTYRDGDLHSKRKTAPESIYVHSITSREHGWKAADISSANIRDNIYVREADGGMICGYKNWDKYQNASSPTYRKYTLIRKRSQKYDVPFTKYTKQSSSSSKRRIDVYWGDDGSLITGVVGMKQSSSGGRFDIYFAQQKKSCRGGYALSSEGQGEWRLKCDDGQIVWGKLVANGAGKGSSGVGEDLSGRKVTYTIHPAN